MALITCKECKKEVSKSAKVCPHCGVSKPAATKGDTVKGFFGLVIIIFGAFIWLGSDNDKGSGKVITPEPSKEIVSYTAVQLSKAYEENEVATDEALKGKLVNITGRVQSIDKDYSDSIIVKLRTLNEYMPASMDITDKQKALAASLRKGDKISITCEKMSRLVGEPYGRDCVINQPDEAQPITATKTTQSADKKPLDCDEAQFECLVEKAVLSALPKCQKGIENKAGNNFKWGKGRLFSVSGFDKKANTITLKGNNISITDANGASSQLSYTCKIDVPSKEVLSTSIN